MAAILCAVLLSPRCVLAAYTDPPLPYPTNNDPNHQIRFNSAAGADAKRLQLVNYIWSGGLPTSTMPIATTNVGFNSDLNAITQSAVSRVDRLDAKVYGLDNIAYLLSPANTANANRLAIVYMGHASSAADALSYGVGDAANHLLQAGYSVMAMQMPMMGWNRSYNTCTPPGLGAVTITNLGSSIAHDELFAKVEPTLGGATFRFFLEPTIQAINYFKNTNTNAKDVSMIGLSGGSWTTHMAAAVDPRIKLSIPISGSWPLYVRNGNHGLGDYEQVHFPLYDENIAADGTGGGGEGRRQIMMNNRDEPNGLFGGTYADSFKDIVSGVVANQLQSGRWEHVLDVSQDQHIISPWAIDNIILPAMAVPEPSSFVLTAMGLLGLGCYAWKRRR
jgi:hypothetical protein